MTALHGGPPGRTAARDEWPFVGRDTEIEAVTASLVPPHGDRVDDVPGSGAVVVGPAGVGKTRLLREVRRWAETRRLPTATVIATRAASQTPYGAVLHLLADDEAPPPDRSAWHGRFAAALRSAAGPTVLLLDDAHLLDQGSAALLLQLVLEGVVSPVVAVRGGEPTPDPVTALWKDGLLTRVDLDPFPAARMGTLIGRALDGRVSDRTLERLAAVSGGNVLYAQELVAAAVDGRSLRQRDGIWVWDERVVLAPRLLDAVWSRLVALTDDQRRALALVALGEPLPVGVAEALADPAVLCLLEDAGLVRVDGTGRCADLRLAHPLHGEVLLERQGRLDRRHLAAALADAFEADGRVADSSTVRVVTWRLDAGQTVPPAPLLRAAAEANQAFDHELAARFARAALDTVGDDPLSRAAVVVELSSALLGCNHVEEAHELLTEVEDQVLTAGRPSLVDSYLDTRFRASYLGLGRAAEMGALLDRLSTRPDARDEPRAWRVAAYRSSIAGGGGRPLEALRIVEPLLAAPGPPSVHRLVALEAAGEACVHLGRRGAAEQVWEGMRQLATTGEGRTAAAEAEAALQEMFLAQLDGKVAEALPLAEEFHARAAGSADLVNRGLASLALGRCLVLAGRLGPARAVLLDAVADFRKVDLGGSLAWALVLLSQCASLAGRVEAAQDWRDQAEELRDRWVARLAVDVVGADVWLAVGQGDGVSARGLARRGADLFPEMLLARATLLHLACRVGDRSREVVADLRQIADEVECTYPVLLADHAEACRAADGSGLEAVAERFAGRGVTPLADEAANQAARAHRAAGSTDGAQRAAARATVLAEGIEDLLTPALADPEPCVGLSQREEDVAHLAASGLSNASIASRLVLSVRTVESHLYHAFAKLGIASRTELSQVLPGPGTSSRARAVQ